MWLYDMKDNLVSFGFVTMLDSENPNCDAHLAAQKFKTTPYMKWLLDGAELVKYGAKCIPTGGLYSMPKLYVNGALLIGDSASFCNAEKLSGVHLAMKSGMMAADTIVDALARNDYTTTTLGGYTERYRASWAYKEHWRARHFHQSTDRGVPFFMMNEPIRQATGGRGLFEQMKSDAGHTHMKRLADLPKKKREKEEFAFDGVLTFSKEHLVQFSGTQHEADQPSHLVVADTDLCSTTCAEEYGNPCPPRRIARSCSSTTKTASTAKPATSRIPTRSLRGRRRRGARGRITSRCSPLSRRPTMRRRARRGLVV
jgi:electron-transferring-flavoprotein dehydrogenase